VLIEVQDDGVGFDTEAETAGFGLVGMRERVYLAGGTLELQSGEGGTVVRARLPSVTGAQGSIRTGADVAS
jgi:signal transduction histidine kinase